MFPRLRYVNLFYSSVLKGVLSAVEHHGGGEKTIGKTGVCACAYACVLLAFNKENFTIEDILLLP